MKAKKILKNAVLPALVSTGMLAGSGNALACGPDPLLGSICAVGFNFCPRGFAEANGQLLAISQNTALFSLYGTIYGGDGRTTFALPDLRGRSAIGQGQGSGLPRYREGQRGGAESQTLNVANLPSHNHLATTTVDPVTVKSTLRANSGEGDSDEPGGKVLAKRTRNRIYSTAGQDVDMSSDAISSTATASATTTITPAGSSQPFNIRDPYLTIRYCVALQGIYPSRN